MANKKGQKKKGGAVTNVIGVPNVIGFNSTKKNFPNLKKVQDHKKNYVSPYSIKVMQK